MYTPVQMIIDAIKSKIQAVVDKVTEVHKVMMQAAGGCDTAHTAAQTADDTVGKSLQAASGALGVVVDVQVNLQTQLVNLQTMAHRACGRSPASDSVADLQWFEAVVDIWNKLSKAVRDAVSSLVNNVRDFVLGGLEALKAKLDLARKELYEARITAKVAMEKSEFAKEVTARIDVYGDAIRDFMGLAKPDELPEASALMASLQLAAGEQWFWPSAGEKAREAVNAVLNPVREAFHKAQAKIDGAAVEADELHIAADFVQRKAVWAGGLIGNVQAATDDSVNNLIDWLDNKLPKEQQKINALLQTHVGARLAHPEFCSEIAGEGQVDLEWFGSENIADKVAQVSAAIMAPVHAKLAEMRDFLIELKKTVQTAKEALVTVDGSMAIGRTTVGGLKTVLDVVRSDASEANGDLEMAPEQ
jgi:hypothetical protein